ncbi:MAG: serpin family protein [Candidatus Woesearchaeota archaeon]
MISPQDKIIITNAIYFNGDWVMKFDKKKTIQDKFYITDQETVNAKFMQFTDSELTKEHAEFYYGQTNDAQVLELLYAGKELSMLFILPHEQSLKQLEQELTPEKLKTWRANLRYQGKPTDEEKERIVELIEQKTKQENNENQKQKEIATLYQQLQPLKKISIPRFMFENDYELKETMRALGMHHAFEEHADFSKITEYPNDLFIGSIKHKPFVKVDEEGTEAAAATMVKLIGTTMEVKAFEANRPFLLIIQERSTGYILFIGRMVDPSKAQL